MCVRAQAESALKDVHLLVEYRVLIKNAPMGDCTYIHTYIHTHILAHIHIRTFTHPDVHTYIHKYICT